VQHKFDQLPLLLEIGRCSGGSTESLRIQHVTRVIRRSIGSNGTNQIPLKSLAKKARKIAAVRLLGQGLFASPEEISNG
jgi:hypothetical protein